MLLLRTVPVLLLASAVSGFAVEISSFDEANLSASVLFRLRGGNGNFGSFLLNFDQTSTGGRSVISTVSNAAAADSTSAASSAPAPTAPNTFIMQPNLGFAVILTADFSAYQGPDAPVAEPGKVVLVTVHEPAAGSDPVLTQTDVANTAVSNAFDGAPAEMGEVSAAGAYSIGDASAPTELDASQALTSSTTSKSTNSDSATSPEVDATPAARHGSLGAAAAVDSIPEPGTAFGVGVTLACLGGLKRFRKNR